MSHTCQAKRAKWIDSSAQIVKVQFFSVNTHAHLTHRYTHICANISQKKIVAVIVPGAAMTLELLGECLGYCIDSLEPGIS